MIMPSISGPFAFENLSVFILHGNGNGHGLPENLLPLSEALEKKIAVVYETGQVGQLEVENLSGHFEVFIQAGDVVKGGRQDRTLGVDLIVPCMSGKIPVPSFCVESGRWHRRGGEDAGTFGESRHTLSSRKLRTSVRVMADQAEVWRSVEEDQARLSQNLGASVHADASATSYQLSMEDKRLKKAQQRYRKVLTGAGTTADDTAGAVFVVNGVVSNGEFYSSRGLFRKLWPRLLDAAIVEAISESSAASVTQSVSVADVEKWIRDLEAAPDVDPAAGQETVHMRRRATEKAVMFETLHPRQPATWVHRSYLSQA